MPIKCGAVVALWGDFGWLAAPPSFLMWCIISVCFDCQVERIQDRYGHIIVIVVADGLMVVVVVHGPVCFRVNFN